MANTLNRTWTLGGRSVRFGLLMTVGMSEHSVEVAIKEQADREEYLMARRLPGAARPVNIDHMPINELFVGGTEDAEEVTQWFREECRGQYELFFDERTEDEGNVLRFYFRFHDIGDALKFKLQFGHTLDAGAAAE